MAGETANTLLPTPVANCPIIPITGPAPLRCSVCRGLFESGGGSPLPMPPSPSPAICLAPSCGHPLCRLCSDTIVTFSRDIPTPACPTAKPTPPPPPRSSVFSFLFSSSSTSTSSPSDVEFWCSVCKCKRVANLQLQLHTTTSSTGEKQTATRCEVKDESAEGSEATPSDPKRRRKDTAAAASGATDVVVAADAATTTTVTAADTTCTALLIPPVVVELCVMCKEAGIADVTAKYMCEECTKALGGGEHMLYCDSCWTKAHWSASWKSHAKLDLSVHTVGPIEAPQKGTKMCETHQLPLDVFCQTDNTLICSRCILFSSHKGHSITSVEEVSYKNLPSPMAFLGQLSRLESELNTLSTLIKSETVNIKLEQSQFAETVGKEFSDLISSLQRRQNELLLTSETIASSKVCALSKHLEILSTGLQHIDKYKSKCLSILKSGETSKIIDLFESIPTILKQLECKPEHLTLSHHVSATVSSTDDIETFQKSIPGLGVISAVPVLASIKEQKNAVSGPLSVRMFGFWPKTATNNDIQVRVGELQCTNVNVATPGSVLTFEVPQGVGQNLPVSLSVFGTPADRPNDTRFSFPVVQFGHQETLPVSPSRLGTGGSAGTPPSPAASSRRVRHMLRANQALVIESVSKALQFGGKVTITGRGFGMSEIGITVTVNGVQCSCISVTHPDTEVTCTVPPLPLSASSTHQGTLIMKVGTQQATSSITFGTWEWDPGCCGNLLGITASNSTVYKPAASCRGYKQSTVTTTTQLQDSADTRVYQWHLSISNLRDFHCYYGLIAKPFDQNGSFPNICGWSTGAGSYNLPQNTPAFTATGGTEEVTLMYDPSALTLTARWPLHSNATVTVNNIPSGLYPAVNIYDYNTVRITQFG